MWAEARFGAADGHIGPAAGRFPREDNPSHGAKEPELLA